LWTLLTLSSDFRYIQLHVLERYGIENYFPRAVLEAVVKRDLASFFPVPHHISTIAHLSVDRKGLWYRLRLCAAEIFSLKRPNPRQPLFAKSRNAEVAPHLVLDRDLGGTDLHAVMHLIADRTKEVLLD
jgi:hypothetical protein